MVPFGICPPIMDPRQNGVALVDVQYILCSQLFLLRAVRGFAKLKKCHTKNEITMPVGVWVQVSRIFFGISSQNSPILISLGKCILCEHK